MEGIKRPTNATTDGIARAIQSPYHGCDVYELDDFCLVFYKVVDFYVWDEVQGDIVAEFACEQREKLALEEKLAQERALEA